MKEHEFIIGEVDRGERLDQFLAARAEVGLTRSQVHRLIEDGYVEVNKEVPKPSHRLKAEDRVIIRVPPPEPLAARPENIPLDIVYEDPDIIVVNKPRGMVVHPAAGNYTGTLVNALLFHCRDLSGIGGKLRPGIVHRLDKDTSGLLVAAKSDRAHRSLAGQFKDKLVFKKYLALVHGSLERDEGVIESRIGRHPIHRKKMTTLGAEGPRVQGAKGRDAVTFYKVKERFKKHTLVELILKTGRTHQIRVHLTSIGHPVVGDQAYGKRQNEFGAARQLLHAAALGFSHPVNEEHLEFKAEPPDDLLAALNRLRSR